MVDSTQKIQVVYTPGTYGNCVRWLLDRFSPNSKFKDMVSPWDKDGRVHEHPISLYNERFLRGHQVSMHGDMALDPAARKIVISFSPRDLLFVERCRYYRTPGMEDDYKRYKNIISLADSSFVKETFGSVSSSQSVAKELLKIQFHDMGKHLWWSVMHKFITDETHYQLDVHLLCDENKLIDQFTNIAKKYNLNFEIDKTVIQNVVQKINNDYVIKTKDRVHQIIAAIESKRNIKCNNLDIPEQAFIEAMLEQKHDCIIFPYGLNWFTDTDQINEFLDTYPKYLKHINPRLPWYNNVKNPVFLTGRID